MLKFIVIMTERYGYIGILLLIFLENVFPPIPSEIILPFSGFMTTKTCLGIAGVVIAATIGSVLGALVLYLAGSLLRPERLEKAVSGKIGKLLHFKMEHIQKAEQSFQKYGKLSALFLRCVPIVRSLVSIPAGMAGMDIVQFFIYTVIGSLVWNILLVSLGAALGESWELVSYYIAMYADIVKIVVITAAVTLLAWKGWECYKKKRAEKEEESGAIDVKKVL